MTPDAEVEETTRSNTVVIVATGGTIANTAEGRISIADVLRDVERSEGLLPSVDLQIVDILRESAATLTPAKWVEIARAVRREVDHAEVLGVVVTHGTFTVEETAYFLHLTIRSDKPVVLACAQRVHGSVSADGDQNLLDAIRLAAAPDGRGLGAIVPYNEEIHCARDVTKTSGRLTGFTSHSAGILGTVDQDEISIYRRPTRRHSTLSEFDLSRCGDLPRVDIVASYPGADGVAVDAFLDAGAKGLVVDGFAYSGRPFDDQVPSLIEAISRGIPVVKVSRGRDGRIPHEGKDRFICGDNLTAQKARVLLTLALTGTSSHTEIQRIFDEY